MSATGEHIGGSPLSSTRLYLRSARFDALLVLLPLSLGLGACGLVSLRPDCFEALLYLNLYALGYQHVAVTFSRLCFDRQSFRRHWPLVVLLPPLVIVATYALARVTGVAAVTSVYFFWQWWHYARQSAGVTKACRPHHGGSSLEVAVLSLPVLWALCHRVNQAEPRFLSLELWLPPLPGMLEPLLAAACVLVCVRWLDVTRSSLGSPRTHRRALASQALMFVCAGVCVERLDHGWLGLNVWHNTQYLLFVWHANQRRFAEGESPEAPLLSGLCQRRAIHAYVLVFLALGSAIYGVVALLAPMLPTSSATGAGLALIGYQAINFHHYLVDATIWRSRSSQASSALWTCDAHDVSAL